MAGSLRGTDSAGLAIINTTKGDIVTHKLPVAGPMFITDKHTGQLIKKASNVHTVAIAHTRSATAGSIGLSEAHPFEVLYDDSDRTIVGVHNGTLTGWASKPKGKEFDVDSEWALNHIFLKGADAFKDFNGAYCFVWYDTAEPDTLNIALNDQRPMFVAMNNDGGMSFASEAGMLVWLCERNNIVREGPVLALDSYNWYKFDTTDPSIFTKEAIARPVVAVAKAAAAPVNYSHHKDTTERMDALLAKIAASDDAQPVAPMVPATQTTLALVHETPEVSDAVENARVLDMLGDVGEFTPIWLDDATGDMYGEFVHKGLVEYDAIIYNARHLEWNTTEGWKVKCVGVEEDGQDLTVVCGLPLSAVKAVPKAVPSKPAVSTPTSVH